jgi:xylulose-5-phosphate/fructose-6-phosphate phosphoketolase
VQEIRRIQQKARQTGKTERPRWPVIILRTPKGWTGPKEVDGHKVEDFWRSHQVPVPNVQSNPAHLKIVKAWLRSYKPEELFDSRGALIPELRELPPQGDRRMSANPHANGGKLRKPLDMPAFADYAIAIKAPGTQEISPTETLGKFLRDVMKRNMNSFRLFSPDENASNRLQDVYEASLKTWLGAIKPEDADGTDISPDGRVMEMLSEHTLEGWL